MGFGQHQSFYLRDGWLHKGLEVVDMDPALLSNPSAFERMGIGKNMVASLRFWIVATRVANYNVQTKEYSMTELGRAIFQNDSNINLSFTKGLVHYNLVKGDDINDSNGRRSSTVVYWFFNILEGNIFEKEALLSKYTEWVSKHKHISANSLKRDVDVLLQMYDINNKHSDPEDVLHSPLSELGLVMRGENIIKLEGKFSRLDDELIYYILVDYMIEKSLSSLTFDDIATAEKLPGRLFNLKREEVLKAIFSLQVKELIEFSQTNNLDAVYIKNLPESPIEIINQFYIESGANDECII